jgi:hypothetical protein
VLLAVLTVLVAVLTALVAEVEEHLPFNRSRRRAIPLGRVQIRQGVLGVHVEGRNEVARVGEAARGEHRAGRRAEEEWIGRHGERREQVVGLDAIGEPGRNGRFRTEERNAAVDLLVIERAGEVAELVLEDAQERRRRDGRRRRDDGAVQHDEPFGQRAEVWLERERAEEAEDAAASVIEPSNRR